jgi:pimeloyl-ACP methyl ester carboxylesterase
MGALLGVVAAMGLSGCFERFAFVPTEGTPYPTPSEVWRATWRDVYFPSRDGLSLHGWHIEGVRSRGEKPRAVVVHAHGNAGNMGAQRIPALRMCLDAGGDVLMFDYRSYGLSAKGGLTRFAAVDDLAGALAFAHTEFPDARILLLGQSMGGATAALAMREEQLRSAVDGLCLISSFADWNVEVCDVLKSNPLTWLFAYPLAYTLISPSGPSPRKGSRRGRPRSRSSFSTARPTRSSHPTTSPSSRPRCPRPHVPPPKYCYSSTAITPVLPSRPTRAPTKSGRPSRNGLRGASVDRVPCVG